MKFEKGHKWFPVILSNCEELTGKEETALRAKVIKKFLLSTTIFVNYLPQILNAQLKYFRKIV